MQTTVHNLGESMALLEDMFNEQVTIGGKTVSNTQAALELVQKLNSLELISEENRQVSQNGNQGFYSIN